MPALAACSAVSDDVLNRVVERQPVGDVAARTVDVQRDGFCTVVRQFAEPFDGCAGAVLLDVPDEINVAQAVRLLFADDLLDGVHQFVEQAIVDFAHT